MLGIDVCEQLQCSFASRLLCAELTGQELLIFATTSSHVMSGDQPN